MNTKTITNRKHSNYIKQYQIKRVEYVEQNIPWTFTVADKTFIRQQEDVTFFDLGKYVQNIPITSVSYNKERGTTELMRGG
jgi:hypothetical protein